MGIDPPQADGRPDPRRFQYPVGWNLPVGQPGTEGIKLATFSTLRAVADMFSVARSCVNKRVSEIVGLEWDIVPTDEAEHAMRGDDAKRGDWEKRRALVHEFFEHPDSDRGKFPTWGAWMTALLEDLFVLDAVAVHLRPAKSKTGGPFNSGLASLDVLDGSTIRPLLDTYGATPPPPAVAYQQYIWGVPRVDLTSVMLGTDMDGMSDQLVQEYDSSQLMYLRYRPRNWTPYGFGPVEEALLPIMIGLARQQYQWDYFQDGSIPGQFVTPGPDISTPQQIRQLQDALNAMAGDVGAKHRIIVLPPGSKAEAQKSPPMADQFDEWIVSQVTMPFDLTPMDLGVTPRVSAIQSPAETKQISQINTTQGLATRVEPITSWLKQVLFDWVIQGVFGQDDMQWSWGLTENGEDEDSAVELHVTQVQNGLESVDEARVEMGKTPWGLPETSVPLVFGQGTQGVVPLAAAAQQAQAAADQAQAMAHLAQHGGAPAIIGGKPGEQQQGNPGQGSTGVDEHGEPTTPAHEAAEALPESRSTKPGGTSTSKPAADSEKTEKALRTDLEILKRHLRKGRPLETFRSDVIPAEVLAGVGLDKGLAEAIASIGHRARRAIALSGLVVDVAKALGKIAYGFRTGKLSFPTAVDQAVAVMRDGYRQAMASGSGHAAADHHASILQFPEQVSARAEQQRGYVTRLMGASMQVSAVDDLGNRLDLYGQTLHGAYNQAYGLTVHKSRPDYELIWHLGNAEHCAPCRERAGKSFTFDTMPGWPGDGGFGGDLCEGGPNCACWYEYREAAVPVAAGGNTQRPGAVGYYQQQRVDIDTARDRARRDRSRFLHSIPGAAAARAAVRDSVREQLAEVANQAIAAAGGYGGVTVEPADIPAALVAQVAAGAKPDVTTLVDGMWPLLDGPQFRKADLTVHVTRELAKAKPVAAGLAVRAANTGRVLMLQRALSGDDPAAGRWEFPGGHIEPGETAYDGAVREWQEETGIQLPAGEDGDGWESGNGVYRGYVHEVPSEDSVPIHDGRDDVTNPDDPDGDQIEALAWWDPQLLVDNPAVRDELAADLDRVLDALGVEPGDVHEAALKSLLADLGKWDPARHPRGPGGRFISAGETAGHASHDHREHIEPGMTGDLGQHMSQLVSDVLLDGAGAEPSTPGRLTDEQFQQHLKAVAALVMQSNAYTDEQVKQATDNINQMRSEMHHEKKHEARLKLAIGIAGIVASLLLGIYAGPLFAVAPFIGAELGKELPKVLGEVGKELASWRIETPNRLREAENS